MADPPAWLEVIWSIGTLDGRKLSYATLAEIRKRAMQRVIEGGESPEKVVSALGFHRSVIYQWPAKFRNGGMAALEEKPVPGRPTKLRPAQLQRLYQLVVGKNPLQLRFAYGLWRRAMIQELIWREWQVSLSESAVARLLRSLGLSAQKPLYRAYHQNPEAVQRWQEVEFPAIQKLARQEGAQIFFCQPWCEASSERPRLPTRRCEMSSYQRSASYALDWSRCQLLVTAGRLWLAASGGAPFDAAWANLPLTS